LLGSYSEPDTETTTIARQQISKYAKVPEPFLGNERKQLMEALMEAVFPEWYVSRLFNEQQPHSKYCKLQTRLLVRKGASNQHTRKRLTVIKTWSLDLHGCLTPRQIGRQAVGRNTTITVALSEYYVFYVWVLHPVARIIKVIRRPVPSNKFKRCSFYLYFIAATCFDPYWPYFRKLLPTTD
jgi:hypothetical protein